MPLDDLVQGVLVVDRSSNLYGERIHFSSGTCAGDLAFANFQPGAIIPRLPWRSATDSEMNKLDSPSDSKQNFWTVYAGCCPESWHGILDQFSKANTCASRNEALDYLLSINNTPNSLLLNSLVSELTHPGSPATFHRTYVWDCPGMPTVTRNHQDQLIGLHVDAWDFDPNVDEHELRWRMSINIGISDRYFIFLNLTPDQLRHYVHDDLGYSPDIYQGTQLGRAFLKNNPDYPIIRLTLKQYEYYIAPTESIVHDGSSGTESKFDIHLTWRGNFSMIR